MHRYGTRYETRDERLTRIVDRDGTVHAELAWNGDALVRLAVPGLVLDGAVIDDPLLGRVHRIGPTTISAIDWARPTEIPAIANPGALPPGTGRAVMNTLAVLAAHANVPALYYAGPYPTHALYETLRRSFRAACDDEEFTREFWPRAGKLVRDPMPYAFTPAPHERLAVGGGVAELRTGLERWTHGGITYSRDTAPHMISEEDPGFVAQIWLAGPYARIATFAADGALLDGPHPVPRLESPVIGQAFPPPLVAALAELCAQMALPVVAVQVREHVGRSTFVWADLGVRVSHVTGDTVSVNAAIWEHVAPHGMARLATTLVEVLTPVLVNHAMLSLCASFPS